MADTYTQIHIHAVFKVKNRAALIQKERMNELFKYATGIIQRKQHKLLAINGMPDHIHIYMGIKPSQSVADLIREIKTNTSKWVNEKNFTKQRFEWQEGYGVFSHGKSDSSNVIAYI